jgi:integrase
MVSKNRLTQIDRERIAWAKSFKAGEKWFLKLRAKHGEKPGTQKYYVRALKEFSEYVGMTPDEIIDAYKEGLKEDVNQAIEEWNEKLELFVPWIVDEFGLRRSVAASWFSAIKSFFKYNVAIKLTAAKPEFHSKSYNPVTIDELRNNILPFADIYQTFEILFLKDSGMSQSDVLRLNVGDIEDLGSGFGYIKTFREKEGVDYETFVGPNTTEAMRKCLDFRRRLGFEITNESPLFVKKHKPNERLTASLIQGSLRRLSKKAGVIVSTHRLRKTFETFLAIGKVHPIILKYWIGHKVKRGKTDIEAKYIIPPKPDQLKVYMEAYQHIDIEAPKLSEDERRIRALIDNARMLGVPEEQIEALLKERGKTWHKPSELAMRMRAYTGRTETNGGSDCSEYKEISEGDLLSHLQNGWRIVHANSNGKVIVSKGT